MIFSLKIHAKIIGCKNVDSSEFGMPRGQPVHAKNLDELLKVRENSN